MKKMRKYTPGLYTRARVYLRISRRQILGNDSGLALQLECSNLSGGTNYKLLTSLVNRDFGVFRGRGLLG